MATKAALEHSQRNRLLPATDGPLGPRGLTEAWGQSEPTRQSGRPGAGVSGQKRAAARAIQQGLSG